MDDEPHRSGLSRILELVKSTTGKNLLDHGSSAALTDEPHCLLMYASKAFSRSKLRPDNTMPEEVSASRGRANEIWWPP